MVAQDFVLGMQLLQPDFTLIPSNSPSSRNPTTSTPTTSPTSRSPTASGETFSPSHGPTTLTPTGSPTAQPSQNPSFTPTVSPSTFAPTNAPTIAYLDPRVSRFLKLKLPGSLNKSKISGFLDSVHEKFDLPSYVEVSVAETGVAFENVDFFLARRLARSEQTLASLLSSGIESGINITFDNLTSQRSYALDVDFGTDNLKIQGDVTFSQQLSSQNGFMVSCLSSSNFLLTLAYAGLPNLSMKSPLARRLLARSPKNGLAYQGSARIGQMVMRFQVSVPTKLTKLDEGTRIKFEVSFLEDVMGFSADGVQCEFCDLLFITAVQEKRIYEVIVKPWPDIFATLHILSGAAQNSLGIFTSPVSKSFVLDTTPPTVIISSELVEAIAVKPFLLMLNFSEPISQFDVDSMHLTHAVVADFQSIGSYQSPAYSVLLRPLKKGLGQVEILANSVFDLALNPLKSQLFLFKFRPRNLAVTLISPRPDGLRNLTFVLFVSEELRSDLHLLKLFTVQNGEVLNVVESTPLSFNITVKAEIPGNVELTCLTLLSRFGDESNVTVAETLFNPCLRCSPFSRCEWQSSAPFFSCTCLAGYIGTGRTCAKCPGGANNTCSGKGHCSMSPITGRPMCSCQSGWLGADCSVDRLIVYPSNITTKMLSFTSVFLSWEIPQNLATVILGYRIFSPFEMSLNAQMLNATFGDLPAGKLVTFRLAVVTENGIGSPVTVYQKMAPVVNNLKASSSVGLTSGGEILVLSGRNFIFSGSPCQNPDFPPVSVHLKGVRAPCALFGVVTQHQITCFSPPGAGTNHEVYVVSCGIRSTTPVGKSVAYSYAPPRIDANSLRVQGHPDQFGKVTGPFEIGNLISFTGINFGNDTSSIIVSMTNGDIVVYCTDVQANHFSVNCSTGLGYGRMFAITVEVQGQAFIDGGNQFSFPDPPVVHGLVLALESKGLCVPKSVLQNGVQKRGVINCPTEGGVVLGITGENFGYEEGLIAIFINTNRCGNIRLVNTTYATCVLPEGTGTLVPVVVRVSRQQSLPANILSFARPEIFHVSGCTLQVGAHTKDCPREQRGVRITLSGQNFGRNLAQILIQTTPCLNVVHDSGQPHRSVSCSLPRLRGTYLTVYLIQEAGTISTKTGLLSYDTCKPGTRYKSLTEVECIECLPGKYSTSDADSCTLCDRGTFSNESRTSTCSSCPTNFFQSEKGRTNCQRCQKGWYTPFVQSFQCSQCPVGRFASDGICRSCPANTVCQNGLLTAADNFWVMQRGDEVQVFRCASGLCKQGDCGKNREGVLCGECQQGFYPFAGDCEPCKLESELWILVPILINQLLVLFTYITAKDIIGPFEGYWKILVFYAQTALVIFPVEFLTQRYLTVISIFSMSQVFKGTPTFCFKSNPSVTLLIEVLQPIFALAQLMLQMLCHFSFSKIRRWWKGTSGIHVFYWSDYRRTCVALFLGIFHTLIVGGTSAFGCVEVDGRFYLASAPAVDCDSQAYLDIYVLCLCVLCVTFGLLAYFFVKTFQHYRAGYLAPDAVESITRWIMYQDFYKIQQRKRKKKHRETTLCFWFTKKRRLGSTNSEDAHELEPPPKQPRNRLGKYFPTFFKTHQLLKSYGPLVLDYDTDYFFWDYVVMGRRIVLIFSLTFNKFSERNLVSFLGFLLVFQFLVHLWYQPFQTGKLYKDSIVHGILNWQNSVESFSLFSLGLFANIRFLVLDEAAVESEPTGFVHTVTVVWMWVVLFVLLLPIAVVGLRCFFWSTAAEPVSSPQLAWIQKLDQDDLMLRSHSNRPRSSFVRKYSTTPLQPPTWGHNLSGLGGPSNLNIELEWLTKNIDSESSAALAEGSLSKDHSEPENDIAVAEFLPQYVHHVEPKQNNEHVIDFGRSDDFFPEPAVSEHFWFDSSHAEAMSLNSMAAEMIFQEQDSGCDCSTGAVSFDGYGDELFVEDMVDAITQVELSDFR